MLPIRSIPFLLLAGFGVCLGVSLAVMRWVAPLGWMDVPRDRHQHAHPTPRTGGIALLAAMAVGLGLGWVALPLGRGEWAMVYAMGFMGALDDLADLKARLKSMVSLLCAATLAALTWPLLKEVGPLHPLFFWQVSTGTILAFLLLWVWYWCIPQACNLIDGLNGLALGFFLLLGLSMGFPLVGGGQGAYLLGTLAALVVLNWPRGMQFLGDSGSLALGTLFTLLSIHLLPQLTANKILACFAYPIVDVLMVMAIRGANGESLWKGDRNHFHHQWLRVTGGRRQAALVLTLLPAAACMQVLSHYPGHLLVARAGVGSLLLLALGFFARSVTGSFKDWLFRPFRGPNRVQSRMGSARAKRIYATAPASGGSEGVHRPDAGDTHEGSR